MKLQDNPEEPMQNQPENEDLAEHVKFEIHGDPDVETEEFIELEPQVVVYLWVKVIIVVNQSPTSPAVQCAGINRQKGYQRNNFIEHNT